MVADKDLQFLKSPVTKKEAIEIAKLYGSSNIGYLQLSGGTMTGDITFDSGKGVKTNIITESTTSRTLSLTDAYAYIRTTNSSAINITVPPESSVAFENSTRVEVIQAGTGQVSFVAGSGVTINTVSGLKLFDQYSSAMLIKVGTNEWDLIGNLVP